MAAVIQLQRQLLDYTTSLYNEVSFISSSLCVFLDAYSYNFHLGISIVCDVCVIWIVSLCVYVCFLCLLIELPFGFFCVSYSCNFVLIFVYM